jgi:hypothetical protein
MSSFDCTSDVFSDLISVTAPELQGNAIGKDLA